MRVSLGFRRAMAIQFILIALSFIHSVESQAQMNIEVDLNQERQIMDGTAGNIYGFVTSWSSNVMSLILNDIHVTHLRLRSWIHEWEPSNDNSDPNKINWAAFDDSGLLHMEFELLELLQQHGIECVLGIWEVPPWMVLNPGANEDRIIPPSMYPEFAELIVSYLIYAKNTYNAEINIIGIQNEPNIGIKNYFTPTELADVTEVILDALDKNGFGHVKLHVGDVNEPSDGIKYFGPSLARPAIEERCIALSYHTWHNMTESNLSSIANYAKAQGKKTWATEVGTSPLNSTTFDWALGSMRNHHKSLKFANSSMTFQWCLGGAETSISKTGTPYPIYYALKHYNQHINPGSVRVDTSGDNYSTLTTAFVDKKEKSLSIVVINMDAYAKSLTFKFPAPGFEFSKVTVYKTTASDNYKKTGSIDFDPDGTFTQIVDSRSFYTFKCYYKSALTPDVFELSASTGGSVHLELDAGPVHKNRDYLILGSLSGVEPGFYLPGNLLIHLKWDLFSQLICQHLNSSMFKDFCGVLNNLGAATAELVSSPSPAACGMEIYFAYALANPFDFTSNTIRITVTP